MLSISDNEFLARPYDDRNLYPVIDGTLRSFSGYLGALLCRGDESWLCDRGPLQNHVRDAHDSGNLFTHCDPW